MHPMSSNANLLTTKIGYFSVEEQEQAVQSNQPAQGLKIPSTLSIPKPTPMAWQSRKANASPENIAANHAKVSPEPVQRASGNDEIWDEF